MKAFLAEGHRVIALKRSTSDMYRLAEVRNEVIFYDLDNLDLAKPFTEHGFIDAVVHTATCYGRGGESVANILETNTAFPLRLLETAIVFNTGTFFNTDTILYPYLNAYALSKKHFADWGRQLATPDGIRFINIRLEHIYGSGDDPSKFTTWVVECCVNNVTEIELTAGEQRRDFIHISDAVSAYACLLERAAELGTGFQVVDLGCGEPVSVRSFVETVHRLSSSSSTLRFGALPYREHEQMKSCADTSCLNKLGWRCRTSLTEGVANLIKEKMV